MYFYTHKYTIFENNFIMMGWRKKNKLRKP